MFYANGIGPINRLRNAEFSRKILNMVDIITVRERLSYNEIKKIIVFLKLIKNHNDYEKHFINWSFSTP